MKNIKIILIILSVFLLDQITKVIVTNFLNLGSSFVVVKNFFSITYAKNYGAAFGIFENRLLLIVIVSLILFIYLIYELRKNKDKKLLVVSISFIIGGLIGNLVDRIFLGYVRDFLDFTIFGYDFAIFNLSDTFIVIGACMFALLILMEEKNVNRRKRNK